MVNDRNLICDHGRGSDGLADWVAFLKQPWRQPWKSPVGGPSLCGLYVGGRPGPPKETEILQEGSKSQLLMCGRMFYLMVILIIVP